MEHPQPPPPPVIELLQSATKVMVKCEPPSPGLSGLVQDLSGWEVKVLSPDAAQPQFADLSLHGNVCEFTLRRILHYTVVTLGKAGAVV